MTATTTPANEDALGSMLKNLFPNGLNFCDPYAGGKKAALLEVDASDTASWNEDDHDHAFDKSDDKTTDTTSTSSSVPRSVSVPTLVEEADNDAEEDATTVTTTEKPMTSSRSLEDAPTTASNKANSGVPLRLLLTILFVVVIGTIGSLEGSSSTGSQAMNMNVAPLLAAKEIPTTSNKQPFFGGGAVQKYPSSGRRRPIMGPVVDKVVTFLKNLLNKLGRRNKKKVTIEL